MVGRALPLATVGIPMKKVSYVDRDDAVGAQSRVPNKLKTLELRFTSLAGAFSSSCFSSGEGVH
jgi:hypothetical protein